jgi:hypothetical protein
MSLTEIMASQPAGSTAPEEDDLGFIGMPKGYVATTGTPYTGGPMGLDQIARRSIPQIKPPKYRTGSEMSPGSKSPELIARLQQQLAMAGLIEPSTRFRLGVWDQPSISAYRELLAFANRNGIDREQALQTYLANPAMKPGEMLGGGGAQQSTRLNTFEASDPAGVRQTAEAAFKQTLGRKPSKAELDKFVTSFLGRERDSQDVVFKAQDRLDQAARGTASGGDAPAATESDELWNRIQRMIADSPYAITPGKRSRSYEEQVHLWNEYQAGRGAMAAKPGTSKHGNGRANDLKYSSEKARQWALENAHKYGIHFPLYNPKLGRGKDESWHAELAPGAYEGLPAGTGVAAAPPISQDVTMQRQDVGAQALEFARAENPEETAAYDIGGQFNNLIQILQRGVV